MMEHFSWSTTSFLHRSLVGPRFRLSYSLHLFLCIPRWCSCSLLPAMHHLRIPLLKQFLQSPWEGMFSTLVGSISTWSQLPSSSKASKYGIQEYHNMCNLAHSYVSSLTTPLTTLSVLHRALRALPKLGPHLWILCVFLVNTDFPGSHRVKNSRAKILLLQDSPRKDQQEPPDSTRGTCGSTFSTTHRSKENTESVLSFMD